MDFHCSNKRKTEVAFVYAIVYTVDMALKTTTRIIGIREFRQHLSAFLDTARKEDVHFVLLRHGKIAGHVMPPTKEEQLLHELAEDVRIAREEAERGEGYSSDEARALLGL